MTGAKDRHVLRRDGARLTWSILGPTRVIADHGSVPDAFRGTGAGRALVERQVADARAEGFTVMTLCVRALFLWHPEWADVIEKWRPSSPVPKQRHHRAAFRR